MALLQGHLLRFKNDPEAAIRAAATMGRSDRDSKTTTHSGNQDNNAPKPAEKKAAPVVSKRRVLTVEEVDKMYFNPQPGWDKDLKSLD